MTPCADPLLCSFRCTAAQRISLKTRHFNLKLSTDAFKSNRLHALCRVRSAESYPVRDQACRHPLQVYPYKLQTAVKVFGIFLIIVCNLDSLPGPLAPPVRSLPRRNITALSYSCTTCNRGPTIEICTQSFNFYHIRHACRERWCLFQFTSHKTQLADALGYIKRSIHSERVLACIDPSTANDAMAQLKKMAIACLCLRNATRSLL